MFSPNHSSLTPFSALQARRRAHGRRRKGGALMSLLKSHAPAIRGLVSNALASRGHHTAAKVLNAVGEATGYGRRRHRRSRR